MAIAPDSINNQFDFDKYTSQFDFSKYKEGFREYQKQNPRPLKAEVMMGGYTLPGIGGLGLEEGKQLQEYIRIVAPDYHDQYLSGMPKGSGLVDSLPSNNNGLINPINPSQQTENIPSATNITPINNNQFDFSRYREGFRKYRKQHPLSREPDVMMVASNLPGIGNLEPNASKILSEYLNMVAPDYYNQYLSANKRNGPLLGSLPGDINSLQQTENI